MTACRDWRELPFREIWCVDTEFYPGPGKSNGGRDGDAITPLCLVAYEMRSGRTVRLWQDKLGPFPPYRLDADALIIGYMISAEFGTHIALGWGEPARTLDARDAVARRAGDRAIALACSPGLSRFRARFSRPIILKPHGNVGRDEKRLSQCPGSREARC